MRLKLQLQIKTQKSININEKIDMMEKQDLDHLKLVNKFSCFLPSPGKPLEAKFHGLFTVLQHIGTVDYMIATPGRRRAKHLVHVN